MIMHSFLATSLSCSVSDQVLLFLLFRWSLCGIRVRRLATKMIASCCSFTHSSVVSGTSPAGERQSTLLPFEVEKYTDQEEPIKDISKNRPDGSRVV